MSGNSLRLRLALAAVISIAVALGLAGLGLAYLFERHVERRAALELESRLRELAASIEDAGDGVRLAREPSDPRYQLPFSGYYWQLADGGETIEVSQSLWDQTLALPARGETDNSPRQHLMSGPNGVQLLVLERGLIYNIAGRDHRLQLAVAMDRAEIDSAVSELGVVLAASLALLGTALLAAAWVQQLIGLRPLAVLRQQIGQVRSGTARRLDGAFPSEVMPLVEEVNGLLAEQERSMEKARARAGDLAHGLKTPLTVLLSVARDLRAEGAASQAAEVEEQASTMRRHVERELARVRIGGRRPGEGLPLAPLVERLLGTMRRLPRGQELMWGADLPPGLSARMDKDDLAELLGNLLDNARKWARAKVLVLAEPTPGGVALAVEDDGPGVSEALWGTILERGARLDTARQGSGLGLAIVGDIIDAYGYRLELYRASLGGLGVRALLAGEDDARAGAPAEPRTESIRHEIASVAPAGGVAQGFAALPASRPRSEPTARVAAGPGEPPGPGRATT